MLKAEQNQIIGPIYLTNLPPNIVSIELQSNLIVQDILIYTKLPQSVSLIDISDGNRIESSFFLDEFGLATQRDKAQVQKEKIWTEKIARDDRSFLVSRCIAVVYCCNFHQ